MTKKKTLRLRRRSRKTGGGINCKAEGFTDEIAEATSGRNYLNAKVNHYDSEQWSYESLVDISTRGIVGWYCKQVNLTPEQCTTITSMPEVQILGAFLHRYKVFCEHIKTVRNKLTIKMLFGSKDKFETFVGKMDKMSTMKNTSHYEALNKSFNWLCFLSPKEFAFGEYADDESARQEAARQEATHIDFNRAEGLIEATTDKVQCLLWVIVRHNGLPAGFVMDERIKKYAETPIILGPGNFPETVGYREVPFPVPAVLQIGNLIETVFAHNDILKNPPVTFGVY